MKRLLASALALAFAAAPALADPTPSFDTITVGGKLFTSDALSGAGSISSSGFAAAVATGKPMRLAAGTYPYTGPTVTVPNDLTLDPGALIACTGSNLVLTGSINAGRYRIFAPGCTPSFAGNPEKLTAAFPEWWGAVGDYAGGGTGTGTDNTLAFQNAINSGVGALQLSGQASYRFTSLTLQHSNFAVVGLSRDTSQMWQDDPTGLLDGILQSGHYGGFKVADVGFNRIQPGIGQAAYVYAYTKGAGYTAGQVLAVPGGTASQAAAVTVDTVDGSGGILTAHVSTPGAYTKAPQGLVAPTSSPGSGAQLWITWGGPSLLHFEDSYFVQILGNQFGGPAWNGITIDSANIQANKFYIRGNQVFGMENDGVFAMGSASYPVGDIFVESQNYIQQNGRAGVEFYQNIGGSFVTDNAIYANGIGVIADTGPLAPGAINDLKVRHNDVDSNTTYSVWYKGVTSGHYQQNWTSAAGGRFVCTLCANISMDGFHAEGAGSGITLNGSSAIEGAGALFAGSTLPLAINPYGATASKNINFTGAAWTYGSGYFVTFGAGTPAPDFVTVGVQLDGNEAVATGGNYPAHFTVVGATSPSNINNTATSQTLWGQSNSIFNQNGAAGGYGNIMNGYSGVAIGQYNNLSGPYSQLRGQLTGDHGLFGSDCWSSGATSGAASITYAGQNQACRYVLYGTIGGGTTGRLTSDGLAASAINTVNVVDGMARNMSLQIIARDVTTPGNSYAWTVPVSLLTRGTGAASTALSLGTPAILSTGTTAGAAVSATADTTNGGLALSFTAPSGSDTWRVTAVINDAEQFQ